MTDGPPGSVGAGQHWTAVGSGLPDLPTYKLVIDPRTQNLYVGNDNGVYILDQADGSSTWTCFGNGMPNVQVKTLVLNPTLNTLAAGTYGRSMSSCTWTVPAPLPPRPPAPCRRLPA